MKVKRKNSLIFLIATFSLLIFYGTKSILLIPGEKIEFTGVIAILMTVLLLGCFLYCLSYIAGLQIHYTHGAKQLNMQKYLFYMGRFFFLALGIWFVFPWLKMECQGQKLTDL